MRHYNEPSCAKAKSGEPNISTGTVFILCDYLHIGMPE